MPLIGHAQLPLRRARRSLRRDVRPPHPTYLLIRMLTALRYAWDSYFIFLGLLQDGKTRLAQNMVRSFAASNLSSVLIRAQVDNAIYMVEHYGAVLNGNRSCASESSLSQTLAEHLTQTTQPALSFPFSAIWYFGCTPSIKTELGLSAPSSPASNITNITSLAVTLSRRLACSASSISTSLDLHLQKPTSTSKTSRERCARSFALR